MTATTELMAKLVVDWRQHRLRATNQDLVLAAVPRALKDHPCASAYFAWQEIMLFSRIDLGVAEEVTDGLVVPLIKDAGSETLLEIAHAVRDLP